MNGRFLLFGKDQIENNFKRLVDRQIREQRREQRATGRAARDKASTPGEKVVYRRRAQLSGC
jgi:hypothetical protein